MDVEPNDGWIPPGKPAAYRYAFTVLELLISMGVVGMLIGLLMPALMAARESARRATCASNLRQIGAAVHGYHDRAGQLPSAWRPAANDLRFAYGWATQILPELEQSDRWRQLSFQDRPAAISENTFVSPPLLGCPSDITEPVFDLWEESDAHDEVSAVKLRDDSAEGESLHRLMVLPTANYLGVFGTVEADEAPFHSSSSFGDGSLIHNGKVRWADLQRGLSNTLLVGERTMAMVPSTWLGVDFRGEDAACRLVGSAMTRPNCGECDECEFSSRHVGGAAFAWADGHVAMVSDDIDPVAYQQIARRDAE